MRAEDLGRWISLSRSPSLRSPSTKKGGTRTIGGAPRSFLIRHFRFRAAARGKSRFLPTSVPRRGEKILTRGRESKVFCPVIIASGLFLSLLCPVSSSASFSLWPCTGVFLTFRWALWAAELTTERFSRVMKVFALICELGPNSLCA